MRSSPGCFTRPGTRNIRPWCKAPERSSRSSIATGRATAARSRPSAPSSMGSSALDRIQSIDYLEAPAGARAARSGRRRLAPAGGGDAPRATGGRHRTRCPRRAVHESRGPGRTSTHRVGWLISASAIPRRSSRSPTRPTPPAEHSFDVLGADFGITARTARSRPWSRLGSRTSGSSSLRRSFTRRTCTTEVHAQRVDGRGSGHRACRGHAGRSRPARARYGHLRRLARSLEAEEA